MGLLEERPATHAAQTRASSITSLHGPTMKKMPGGSLESPSIPQLTAQHSGPGAPTDSANAPDDVATATSTFRAPDAMYQSSTLLDRPLSYQEMVQRWCQALIEREAAKQMFEAAQQEFNDHASDIVDIVGQPTYSQIHALYLTALVPIIGTRQ